MPFLVLYLVDERAFSVPEAGLAVSAYGFGSLGASLVGGYLADRIGRRNSIALSMFGSAAAMLALSQAKALALIVVLTALTGLAGELYRPASSALLTDLTDPGRRVTAFALYRLAINAGFAAGPAVAGLLAERSFFLVFLVDALTSCALGLVALVALPEGVRVERRDERRGEALRAIRADRGFVLFLLASTAAAFVYFQAQATLPLHVVDAGFSMALYGALISLNGAIVVVLELPLTAVTQRFPARPVMALGFVLTGIGFGLTGLADTTVVLALTVSVWTIGEIVNAPVASAYVADLAPQHLRGRYQGSWSLTWSLGLILAPSLGTALYAVSAEALWAVCAALGALAAALVWVAPERRAAVDVRPEVPERPG